jgi:hypothetical protein
VSVLGQQFRKSLKKRVRRGFRGYPLATIAYYGPDEKRASKVAVGIVPGEGQRAAELRRWYSAQGDVRFDQQINREIVEFLQEQAVRTVVGMERIIGCPHEEGTDYPEGAVCPACPYWAHRDRWTGDIVH